MLTPEIIKAFAGEMTPKFLATVAADAVPNVVPIISLTAPDASTLVFGEFMVWKTRRNLTENAKVCALVFTDDLNLWSLRGEFVEFCSTGPYVEMMNQKTMFRYNAYLGIRRAGVIRVKDVVFHARLSKAGLLAEIATVKLARLTASALSDSGGSGKTMPAQVMEKFSRMKAVRVFSALDADGYPDIALAMSMMPADASTLVFAPGKFYERLAPLERGVPAAASVITFDPVAYQVKGTWQGIQSHWGARLAAMKITEVYSACPPRPGERIV